MLLTPRCVKNVVLEDFLIVQFQTLVLNSKRDVMQFLHTYLPLCNTTRGKSHSDCTDAAVVSHKKTLVTAVLTPTSEHTLRS